MPIDPYKGLILLQRFIGRSGTGRFQFVCGEDSHDWEYLDYRDRLPAPEELRSGLGLGEREDEAIDNVLRFTQQQGC